MKKFGYILVALCFCYMLQSCESNSSIPSDHQPFSMYMNVVKFTSPEYLNYVVVEKDYWGDEEHLCKIRFSGRACEELYIGSSPYIALPNGYYVIDWKWGDFIYPATNFLIDVKWSEVEDRQQKWEYPSIYFTSHFIKEWGYVHYKSIDTYMNTISARNSDYSMPEWIEYSHATTTFQGMSDSAIEKYKEKVRYQDSLRDVYIERLSQIIQEGALSKVCVYNNKE